MTTFVLVEHNYIIRAGIKKLVELVPEFRVLDEFPGPETIPDRGVLPVADIIITNTGADKNSGIELTADVKKRQPDTKVLILTDCCEYDVIKKAFEAGANGYLLSDSTQDEFYLAIQKIKSNDTHCSRKASQALLDKYINNNLKPHYIDVSEREKEIIELISQGLNTKEIGGRLFLATKTIDALRAGILQKLKAKNTAEMVRIAMEFKLIG
ncbi:MAG: LuxR C-terminal-related transcriptional regulator [Bacteroidia bacterium]